LIAVPEAGPWIETWLSRPRFAVYLSAASQDVGRALALYEWNATVSAAFLHDLAHLEVGLRNAYDVAICRGSRPGQPHWIHDSARLFPPVIKRARNGVRYYANQINRDQIARATLEASSMRRRGRSSSLASLPPSPGKVIAELMFGFWRYLSTAAQHHALWIPYLHYAFPAGTRRDDVDRPIGRLHDLRNRVAHHEPLLRQDLAARHHDLLTVAGLISTQLRDYISDHSAFPRLMSARP
jgi:hypothetical protein